MTISAEKRFFHWFLEFPEVFSNGGFDVILGNPPFLGDRKLKETYGEKFLEWIRARFTDGATIDLVGYFFLRINAIIKLKGFQSLISTNTITQGKAREAGLEKIIKEGSEIIHAVKTMPWPGLAAVEVSLISIVKSSWERNRYLNGKQVEFISSFLDTDVSSAPSTKLLANSGLSFQGNILVGKGFMITKEKAKELISKDSCNKKVLFPFLNGYDITHHPMQEPKEWVISFFDRDEKESRVFHDVFQIIETKVRPERQRWAIDKQGNEIVGKYALRNPLPIKWWQHCEKRPALYNRISEKSQVLVIVRISKFFITVFVPANLIYSDKCIVVTLDDYFSYGIISSNIFESWTWKHTSTIRSSGLIFTPGSIFETFPFPSQTNPKNLLETAFKELENLKKVILTKGSIGLVDLNNLLHDQTIGGDNNLYVLVNSVREQIIIIDNLVLEIYGWTDIVLRHDFYEIDYMSEKDNIRYTIHPEARKEVLKRLLLLNHERFEEEVAKGLHKRKDVTAYFEQKGKPIPEGTVFSDGKAKKSTPKKTKSKKIEPPKEQYGLFDTPSKQIIEGSKVDIRKDDGTVFKYHITKTAVKGSFTGAHKQIATSSKLSELMLGKKTGDAFDFGPNTYSIIGVE